MTGEQIRGSVAEIVADAGTRHTVRVIQDELRDTGGPELAPTTS